MLNVNFQPYRIHEYIFVFGKGGASSGSKIPMKYNPQKIRGIPYTASQGSLGDNWRTRNNNFITENKDGLRHPKTIQKFIRDKEKIHSTQKPVALCKYLIKTYTNENDIVLDNCFGSGTTGVAAKELKRQFIGCELNKEYFDIAVERINRKVLF